MMNRIILNGKNGLARTIKAQTWKNSFANYVRHDGFGATGVVEVGEM